MNARLNATLNMPLAIPLDVKLMNMATTAMALGCALLVIAETSEAQRKEAWRERGAAFFQSKARKRGDGPQSQPDGTLPLDGGAASA